MRSSFFVLFVTLAAAAAAEPGPRAEPPDETRLLNARLPEVSLEIAGGARIPLSSLANGKPLVLGFVFTRCGGVCSPFLRSWRTADAATSRGSAIHRLVLSFDARDSAADMRALAAHVGASDDPDWTFAIAAPDDVRTLTEATGFWYDWDEARQQFDHPAMLAGIRDGKLVRLLVGGSISPARLDELVREATGAFVASYPLPGRVRFRCFQFDPSTGRVTLDWGFALLLVPVVVTTATTLLMFGVARRQPSGSLKHNFRRLTSDSASVRRSTDPW
jgi:cytochrome oxidase Cu insertion factor (SCO1/SenC/PrrC family)